MESKDMRISAILLIFAVVCIPLSAEGAEVTVFVNGGTGADSFFVYDKDGDKVADAPVGDEDGATVNLENGESETDSQGEYTLYGPYEIKLNNVSYEIQCYDRDGDISYQLQSPGATSWGSVTSGDEVTLTAGTVIVLGFGIDTYYLYDTEDKKIADSKTNEFIDMFSGIYTVKLNKTAKTNFYLSSSKTFYAGAVIVTGTGDNSYFLYDATGDEQLGSKKTNEFIEVFPDDYKVQLNDTWYGTSPEGDPITVGSLQLNLLDAGYVTVTKNGNNSFTLNDKDGNELASAKTRENIEVFDGTYTALLHTVEKSAVVSGGGKKEIPAGWLTVKGNENSKYQIYVGSSTEGDAAVSADTGASMDLFPGLYTVFLNGISKAVNIPSEEEYLLESGTLAVNGKGYENDYFVYYGEDQLTTAKTDAAVDFFPLTYRVLLNGTEASASITANNTKTLTAGSLVVSGTGDTTYYVSNAAGDQLASADTNEAKEFFSGTYTVKLNNISQSATVTAGAETTIEAGTITVAGSGDTDFYVYDSSDAFIQTAKTGVDVELLKGNYKIKLNGTTANVPLAAGENRTVNTGTLTVSGTGASQFYVFDTSGKQLSRLDTGTSTSFFPGTYTVKLNKVEKSATVSENGAAELKSATLTVIGSGSDTWYVYDADRNQLAFASTNEEIDLFSGTYTVELNGTERSVTLKAGDDIQGRSARMILKNADNDALEVDLSTALYALRVCSGLTPEHQPSADMDASRVIDMKDAIAALQIIADLRPSKTVLIAGSVVVEGEGIDHYYLLDADGNELFLSYTGVEKELFSGNYQARLNGIIRAAEVKAGEPTTFETGRLTVPGNGDEVYSIWDQDSATLRGYIPTGEAVELFPETDDIAPYPYTVKYGGDTESAEVTAGELTEVTFP